MDNQAVIERLRSDLRAQRDETTAPDWLLGAGHRRWRRRRARRAGAGAVLAAVAMVAVGVLTAGWGDDPGAVDTGPATTPPVETTTTTSPVTTATSIVTAPTVTTVTELPTGPPTQTPEEAARDGIVPAIAELPFPLRVTIEAEAATPEGTWLISRPSEVLSESAIPDSGLGDTSGQYMVDWIAPYDANEVLLIATDGRIVRAYPMSQISPSWLLVTPDAILGGRIADGGEPHATLFRIDRRSLELTGVIFPSADGGAPAVIDDMVPPAVASSWRLAPDPSGPLLHEDPTRTESPVVSGIGGDFRLDVGAAEALLAEAWD